MHSSAFGMAKILAQLNINNSSCKISNTVFSSFSVPVVLCWEIFSFFPRGNKNKQTVYYDSIITRLLRVLTAVKASLNEIASPVSTTEIRQHKF